jgi:glucose-1-phosphate thymidylyltransferase
MDGSKVTNAGRIVESLIGRNVRIRESECKPKGSRLIVGDNSDIML